MEQERKKSFANFGVFIALLANVASSLVTMATALGSITLSYGQAMNGLVLPCLPMVTVEKWCVELQLFFREALNFLEGRIREHNDLVFPRNLQEFVGHGGDGDRGSLG